jgi:hypothetical protein
MNLEGFYLKVQNRVLQNTTILRDHFLFMGMSNEDGDNEVGITFEKMDDKEEDKEEDIEEEEQEAPKALHVVEEHVVSIGPSSVIVEEEDADAENEDILADTTDDDDDILTQQIKGQSVQIEKLAQQVQTLQMRYDESKAQFERINDLQFQVEQLQMQIGEIINKKTIKSKKSKIRKKKTSSSTIKKTSKRNKKQRR